MRRGAWGWTVRSFTMLASVGPTLACGSSSGGLPASGEVISCGPEMYISDGRCVPFPGFSDAVMPVGDADAGSLSDATMAGAADASEAESSSSVIGPAGADFGTYLANPAHTDFVDDSALVPPLARLWTVSLGQPVSYPLVVGTFVYVTTSGSAAAHARVLALQLATGVLAWSADLGTAQGANLASEGARVFEVDTQSTMGPPMLRAFDANSGAIEWQVQADPNQPFYGSPPVAYAGTLYVTGAGTGGDLYAYDEGTGEVSWEGLLYESSAGAPAVSSDGVFVFDSCGATTAFGLDGGMIWQNRGGCAFGVGTAVIFDQALYELMPQATNERLDTRTGTTLGTFTSDLPPAFGDGMEFDVRSGVLQATPTSSTAMGWTFSPDGGVVTSALVAGGAVYVESSIGTVFALNATSGAVVWSENTGVNPSGSTIFGMAAAHGVLLVPAGDQLIAYGPAGPTFDAGIREYRESDGSGSCPWTLVDGPAVFTQEINPASMAVADVNGDGKSDVVTVGGDSGGGVDVMLGAGDGTFRSLPETATFGDGADIIAIADVDGDGHPDAIAASTYETYDSPNNIEVCRGNGDGTFQSPTLYAVGQNPYGIALADLDASGRPDLVVADGSSGVRVLLNRGDGTFANPVVYGDQELVSVAIGDMNGDGKPDLVLTGYSSTGTGVALTLLGHGDGTFAAPLSNALDGLPSAVAIGDLNADGIPDVVALTSDVEVLLGNGDGTFQSAASFQAGQGLSGVAIGDLDRDGHADLVVTNAGSTSVSVLFGNGDGTFQWQVAFAVGGSPVSPAIVDVNGDSIPDVVACNSQDSISVLLGACAAADR